MASYEVNKAAVDHVRELIEELAAHDLLQRLDARAGD